MKRAFTLIELLVVIAIIAILAAILFPVFAQAKAAAKQTQNLSNMKQISTAAQIYAADYDDMIPADPASGTLSCPSGGAGTIDRWGNYYWTFLLNTYTKQKSSEIRGPKGFFWSPNAPEANPSELSGSRASCIWPQPAQSWGLDCTTLSGSSCTSIKYWSSYAYNEHIGDWQGGSGGAGNLTSWEAPAESFLILEATDSEIEGDELDELYGRTQTCPEGGWIGTGNGDAPRGGHNGGITIGYLDSHAKWSKISWGNGSNQCQAHPTISGAGFINFPPATRGGNNVRVKGWTPIFDN
ncbi:hypothetical protein CCB80_07585 [Armatimonadetes bacterium Uphvl-Ar1]|jgi:prepilin-type N-terminal cleavage/methylation domain-containing protein|nr:hypothetical protein CCB80_07585 [Armatimonadetes bacterium Uphvl-Ar1]